jgi:hypothetical protein
MTNQELRIKVAEARGWKQKTYVDRDPGGAIHRYPGCWFNENEYGDIPLNLPEYTTSMDACNELKNEMLQKGRILYISGWKNLRGFRWDVTLTDCDHVHIAGSSFCKTEEEAICKAYLAWKGEYK